MKNNDDEIYKEKDMSEFNAGIATLQRIHEIKKWLIISTIRNKPREHYKHLKAFYKELYPMMTDETEEQEKYWDKGKDVYNKICKKENLTDDEEIFFDEWELSLRKVEQEKGLNMPKRKDPRFALARM